MVGMSHLLVGFMNLVVASAMLFASPGQRSGRAMRICEGADCNVEAASPNESQLLLDGIYVEPVGLAQGKASKQTLAAEAVDAWCVLGDHRWQSALDWNIYTPILESVKVGMESKGAVAQIIGLADVDDMVKGVRAAAAQGRRPLVFTVGHHYAADIDSLYGLMDKFKEAKQAGAYLVAYQTEPLFNWHRLTGMLYSARDEADRMDADEIWEYSLAHVPSYQTVHSERIVRFVPPGYVSLFDVGIDLDSPRTDRAGIGYIGSTHKQQHDKYEKMFAGHFVANNGIHDNNKLRTFLELYPMQLNEHRFQSCCPRDVEFEAQSQHFESFRMSILLANKACVISAPSSDEDMRFWRSVVTFAEVDDTLATTKKLAGDLNGCRMRSYETYKRDFTPGKLLQDSGFFKTWLPPHGK